NANAYYTDWTDQQVTVPGPSGTFFDARTENAGKSDLWGTEVETVYLPQANTEIYLTISYAKTRFRDYIGRDFNGQPVDLSGNEFPQAPRWTGAVGMLHRWANGFDFDLRGSYTGTSFFTPLNLESQKSDAFFIVDARIGYVAQRWSIHAYARNLFDQQYLTRVRLDGFSTAGEAQVIGLTVSGNI
ncbi:MAG: TonB-dependent receptor, partial [Pseudomonadota bacterium]